MFGLKRELSSTKLDRLRGLATDRGVIAAVAIDQRKSLRKMIANAAGTPLEAIGDEALAEFKQVIAECLTDQASAILLDPEYGLVAAARRSAGCGLLMTYESDGFENPRPHRMLELMPHSSVRRLRELGAEGIKVLLSWSPLDDAGANDSKRALVERIGAECDAMGLPFFLEPVSYDPGGLDVRSIEYARRKPEWVAAILEEFSNPEYGVDVLKVEFPVTARFVEGSVVYGGQRAQTMDEALAWFRHADAAANVPYIYLSAGVGNAEFTESLRMAAASGARFSGVLCGRAYWQDGVPEYVRGGRKALAHWLCTEGRANMRRVNVQLEAATPWSEWFATAPSV